jgi:multidrug transporter EmrE-like cation transporter
VGALLALPFGLALGWNHMPDECAWLCAVMSGLFYAVYYCALAGSYRTGQISIAYPIVRGVAPAAAAIAGIVVYREHPSLLAGAGIGTVCASTFFLSWIDGRLAVGKGLSSAASFAVLAGLASAGYLLTDKTGVKHCHPVLYLSVSFGLGFGFQAVLMRWLKLGPVWQPWREGRIWLAGAACAAGYVLILVVLAAWPISYVVPLRAASVMFSVYAGHKLFGEAPGMVKYAAATAILAGITAIGLG